MGESRKQTGQREKLNSDAKRIGIQATLGNHNDSTQFYCNLTYPILATRIYLRIGLIFNSIDETMCEQTGHSSDSVPDIKSTRTITLCLFFSIFCLYITALGKLIKKSTLCISYFCNNTT